MDNETIDSAEVKKFSLLSDKWWDSLGELRSLHEINPYRIDFITTHIRNHYHLTSEQLFDDLEFLDIGCGGGLLSEPLANLGGRLTSIDPSEENIKAAIFHASKVGLDINYRAITVEQMALEDKKFDVVLNMEVIEHVKDVDLFLERSCYLLKKGGLLFLSTLNRTVRSYILGIIGAEYILNWVPKGTHQWSKFLHPHEVERMLRKNGLKTIEFKGLEFNLWRRQWEFTQSLDINYFVVAEKC
jgi:2-polyprenyl-6-hydroxyphenyl methylase/3-demethylubiquinone-9 3-methyltransferase